MKFYTATTDGGSRGNPGPSGYAAIIRHGEQTVEKLSGFIDLATNNVAEYHGVIAALKYAVEQEAIGLVVYSDSELVVKQMTGEYKTNDILIGYKNEADRLAEKIPLVFFEHIRREQNKEADAFYNETIDKATGKS